ncbi:MAG TPA: hypothetical protein VM555_00085, partial [Tahibacter sp.]|nr:hypothetical protein [Tahibacter sp.]
SCQAVRAAAAVPSFRYPTIVALLRLRPAITETIATMLEAPQRALFFSMTGSRAGRRLSVRRETVGCVWTQPKKKTPGMFRKLFNS